MTDYNNGKWHSWAGGECPVHPETDVEIVTMVDGLHKNTCKANTKGWWPHHYNGIVAFRVVEPYVEPKKPREITVDGIKYREVMDD